LLHPADLLNLLLAADVAFTLYLGFKDLREMEFSIYYLPASLLIPAAIYYLNYSMLLLLFVAVVSTLFVVLLWLGMAGYMDVALVPRIPLILLMSQHSIYSIVGFAVGSSVAYLLYIYRYIAPVLCDKHLAIFGSKLKVRREALYLKYIYPTGVRVEDDVEEVKKKLIESETGECVDAVAGVPLIFVFSLGYTLAFATYVLL